ncbi:MAG: HEPN domain-containing protein [Candidatus Dadabacteria bacterium]|nr:HEPN domain-containing protein [Candidatus Dadabacteria bacterium]
MKDPEQVAVLLEAAERDFSALRAMGNNPDFADEIFGFHAQQAAEKSFKAWLALLGEGYPTTHDLIRLLKMLIQHDENATRFKALGDYGPYAVQFRYITDPSARPLDRDAAVKHLEALLEHVRSMFADLREAKDDQ